MSGGLRGSGRGDGVRLHRPWWSGVASLVAVLASPARSGGPPFGNPAQLASTGFPVVATDPAGTTAVAWIDGSSSDALVYCRTWDSGRRWSRPAPLADASGRELDLAAGGSWVAAWIGDTGGVYAARSPDGGNTWELPLLLDPDGRGVRVTTDGAGSWVVSWVAPSDVASRIVAVRSTDDALSWTGPGVVFAAPAGIRVEPGRVAADGAGTWLAAWREGPSGNDAIATARSVDAAATWAVVAPPAASPESGPLDLAGDGGGRWLLAWTRSRQGLQFPFVVPDVTVVVSRSVDDGRTWTLALPIDPGGERRKKGLFTGPFDRDVQLARDGPGRWVAVWTSTLFQAAEELFSDVLLARSNDGGLAWTMPARVNASVDDPDRSHIVPHVGIDAAGRTIVAWSSNDGLVGAISPEDPFGVLVARSVRCAAAPVAGCAAASAARLALGVTGGSPRFRWTWQGGSPRDFGDPLATDDYFLCAYGADAGETLLLESALPAGGYCGRRHCWVRRRTGYRYRGARGIPSRADYARLGARGGQARIAVAGTGLHLTPGAVPFPALPAPLPLRVQLQASGGCWESRHASAAANTATRLQSRGD